MTDPQNDDIQQKVEQASGGEPAADIGPDEGADTPDTMDPAAATSEDDAPDRFNEDGREAESDRIESMQEEGKGIRGEATEGREDTAERADIRDTAEGR